MVFKKFIIGCLCALGLSVAVFADADTDLYNAVKNGNLPKVQSALSYGANPNQRMANNDGASIFEFAVQCGSKNIVETMIKDAKVPVEINGNDSTMPPLFIAIQNNDADMTELLIRKGANVNQIYGGQTPLLFAANLDTTNVINKILKTTKRERKDLDLEYADEKGNTALHFICDHANDKALNAVFTDYHSEIVNALKKTNDGGWTPVTLYISSKINRGSKNIDVEILAELFCQPGANLATFDYPMRGRNGLFELLAAVPDLTLEALIKAHNREINAGLANLKSPEEIPVLCFGVSEGWKPEVIEFLIVNYNKGDWRNLQWPKSGKYKNLNAIEIMKKNKTENKYSDIFNEN